MQLFLFYFFGSLSVVSALLVVCLQKPTRALLSLIISMFSLAIIYLLLGAPFVAMTNIIVYAGAVLVLFLFVIMLQGIGAQEIPLRLRFKPGYLFLSCFVTVVFFCLVIGLFAHAIFPSISVPNGTVEVLAQKLFRDYLLPFELTSLLLLIGVFAAVSLAKKEDV